MEHTTPIQAIRAKCLDCCCWRAKEVKLCTRTKCALYPFRMGKNPFRAKRQLSEGERIELVNRLSKNRPEIQA